MCEVFVCKSAVRAVRKMTPAFPACRGLCWQSTEGLPSSPGQKSTFSDFLTLCLPSNAFTSIIYSRNDIHWTICYLYLEHSQKKTAQESTRAYRLVSDTFGEWLLSCIVQVTPVSREWIASFILTLGLWQRDGGIGGKDRRKDKKDENWFYRNQE